MSGVQVGVLLDGSHYYMDVGSDNRRVGVRTELSREFCTESPLFDYNEPHHFYIDMSPDLTEIKWSAFTVMGWGDPPTLESGVVVGSEAAGIGQLVKLVADFKLSTGLVPAILATRAAAENLRAIEFRSRRD